MNKLYYLLVLVVVLVITGISIWLRQRVETPPGQVAPEVRHDPDYFLENFNITVYQANGTPAYNVDAAHLNHYPDDDTLSFRKLKIAYRDDQQHDWTTTADTGTALQNIQVMHLNGNVRIQRQTRKSDQEFTITTDTLRIDFPNKRASTESEVKIVSKNSTIQAMGMNVDLAAGQLTLLSEARGHYVPQ